MPRNNVVTYAGRVSRCLLVVGVLLLQLGPFLPGVAWAAPPGDSGGDAARCATCHSTETKAWQNSPHASKGVTCEACHGAYVAEHPKEGVMQLKVDSSVCNQCHASTYEQWKGTPHATAGVQCIGCHLSHSQDFRLTDEALCTACHRDRLNDPAHAAHIDGGVACTKCHVSSVPTGTATADKSGVAAPNHKFSFTSDVCVDCHVKTFQQESRAAGQTTTNQKLLVATDQAQELASQLDVTEEANKTLRSLSVVTLGLGLGLGGMVGIGFVYVVDSLNRRGKDKK